MGVRRSGNAILAILFVAWLAVMTWYVWPRSETELRPEAVIVAPRHEMIRAASLALLALLCVTLLWLFVGARRGRRLEWQRQAGLLALQVGLVFGVASPVLVMLWVSYQEWSRPWRDLSELRAAGGKTYHVQLLEDVYVLSDGYAQAWDVYALSEEVSADQLFRRTTLIGWPERGDREVPVVRPAGEDEYDLTWTKSLVERRRGRLLQSRDGRWVVFAYAEANWYYSSDSDVRIDCMMAFAYDTQQAEFHAGASLMELSPFLLIGADDGLNQDDLEGLLSIRRSPYYNIEDTYKIGIISESATHANSSVRGVAAQMLGEYWDDYEATQATLKALAEADPDEAVREAAKGALVTLDERREEEERWAK